MNYSIKLLSRHIKTLLLLTAVLVLASACIGTGGTESSSSSSSGPLVIPADTSCGVCGMFPARYKQWQTQIVFTDGKMVPFDGAKDMFKYILMMSKFDKKHTKNDIAAIWVKDFGNGAWLKGEKATFVVASKQMGPMGQELIPFENMADAQKFQAEKGGSIHSFGEINMDIVGKLGMGGMKMKGHMKKQSM